MTALTKLMLAAFAGLYGLFVATMPDLPPTASVVQTTVYKPTSTHYSAVQTTNPPTRITTPPLPAAGDCEGWVGVAYGVGWPAAALDTLKLAMQLESGCDPYALGDGGDSVGLMQIHMPSWCVPNRNWPIGWIQHYNLGICGDLWNGPTNLRVALAIWEGWEGSTPGWHHWHALP